jgi:hypothetical protein
MDFTVEKKPSLAETGATYYGSSLFQLRKTSDGDINIQFKYCYIKTREGYGSMLVNSTHLLDSLILAGVIDRETLKFIEERIKNIKVKPKKVVKSSKKESKP